MTPPPVCWLSSGCALSNEFLFGNGSNDLSKPAILPSQSITIVSNSVQAGLEDHEKPIMPRPLDNNSPKIDG